MYKRQLLDGSNAANQKDVVKNAIDILGEDVAVIHVKDFTVKDGKVISMAAGQGIMDYSDLIHFMKKDKPYIHATLEDTAVSYTHLDVYKRQVITGHMRQQVLGKKQKQQISLHRRGRCRRITAFHIRIWIGVFSNMPLRKERMEGKAHIILAVYSMEGITAKKA